MKKIITIVLLLTVFNQSVFSQKSVQWLEDAVFYQIYPSSFKDSDGDGTGDLNGIIQQLDYLNNLGINAIWLNPVFISGWLDGGYDVIDFYSIDPRFGTMNDLITLLDSAHSKNIRICLDLTAGHTSKECVWYKEASKGDRNNEYYGFYVFTDSIAEDELATLKRRHETHDPEIATWGSFGLADAPAGRYYRKNFFEFQPALNYGFAKRDTNDYSQQSPYAEQPLKVRQKLKHVMKYWFDKGVDGFRVDMASSLIKNDDDKKENIKLWQEFRSWIDKEYPDKVLISEWSDPEKAIYGGFHIDFMIHFGIKGYPSLFFQKGVPDCGDYDFCFFDKSGKGSIREFAENFTKAYLKTKDKGFIALPTGNHDFVRLNCGTRNDIDQLKTAMTFFLTMPGVPFIYYGDEIGLKYQPNIPDKEGAGKRAGTRTPMQWTNSSNAGFSSASTDKLYFPVYTDNNRLTVETQEKDTSSLLCFTKKLIALRKSEKALANSSDWELLSDTVQSYPLIYKRTDGKEKIIVAVNPSEQRVCGKIKKQHLKGEILLSLNGSQYSTNRKKDTIDMEGFSVLIIK